MKSLKRRMALFLVLTIMLSANMFVNTQTALAASNFTGNIEAFKDPNTWVKQSNLQVGCKQYSEADNTDTYTYIPYYLQGAEYIQTAWATSTVAVSPYPANAILSSSGSHSAKRLTAIAKTDVYIAAEPLQVPVVYPSPTANPSPGYVAQPLYRYTSQYAWLIVNGWQKTGDIIQTSRNGQIHTFDLYKKTFNTQTANFYGIVDEQLQSSGGIVYPKRSEFVTAAGLTYTPSMYSIIAKPHTDTPDLISNLAWSMNLGSAIQFVYQENLQPGQSACTDRLIYTIAGGTKYAVIPTPGVTIIPSPGWTNASTSLSDSLRGAAWLITAQYQNNQSPPAPTPLVSFTAKYDMNVCVLIRAGSTFIPDFVKNDPTWVNYNQTPQYYMAVNSDDNFYYLDNAYVKSYTAGQTVSLGKSAAWSGQQTYKVALLPQLQVSGLTLSNNGTHLQSTGISVRNNTTANITSDVIAALYNRSTNNMERVVFINTQQTLYPSDPASSLLPAAGQTGYNYHANGPYNVDFGDFGSSVDPKNYYVKVFAWDSMNGMKPLAISKSY